MGLDAYLPQQIFIFGAVFCRIAAVIMTIPALGDPSVSQRIRLAMALLTAGVIAPVAGDYYPPLPEDAWRLAGIVLGEIFIGAFMGLTVRLFMAALNIAGQAISLQTGLAMAQAMDPTQQVQGALVGSFLSVMATALIFATDLHHLMFLAMRESYVLFEPGGLPHMGGVAELGIGAIASAFSLGIRLAAPFFAFGLVFFLGVGLLSRMMPQVQIFFIAMPANIYIGFIILMLTVTALMGVFLLEFEAQITQFLR